MLILLLLWFMLLFLLVFLEGISLILTSRLSRFAAWYLLARQIYTFKIAH